MNLLSKKANIVDTLPPWFGFFSGSSVSLSFIRNLAPQVGTSVQDIIYEAPIASPTLSPSGANKNLPIPVIKTIGKKTTIIVTVIIKTGLDTSVPRLKPPARVLSPSQDVG